MEPGEIVLVVLAVIVGISLLVLLALYVRRSANGMCKYTKGDGTPKYILKALANQVLVFPGLLGFILNYTLDEESVVKTS